MTLQMEPRTLRLIKSILLERRQQDLKWGKQEHNAAWWMNILMEEVGEASKAVLEQSPEQYREEMIQVAAVALAALESFEEHGLKRGR